LRSLAFCCAFSCTLSLSAVLRRASSVIPRNKEVDNGEQVVCELGPLVPFVRICLARTVNHELCASLLEDPLDQLRSVATEAVLVANDNCVDRSFVYASQKGKKSLPLVVEPGPDVGEDFVAGVRSAEVGDLPLEVLLLVGAGDAGVADSDSLLFRFLDLSFTTATKLGPDVALGVEALPAWHAPAADLAVVGPLDQGGVADAELLRDHAAGEEGISVIRHGRGWGWGWGGRGLGRGWGWRSRKE